MTCYVYWIHREVHTDPSSEGYIGITSEFDKRMWSHFKNPETPI
jgi:predicted GIY-YIG superfamily endonuclease